VVKPFRRVSTLSSSWSRKDIARVRKFSPTKPTSVSWHLLVRGFSAHLTDRPTEHGTRYAHA